MADYDQFWKHARRRVVQSSLNLIELAGFTPTLYSVYELITTAPRGDDWQKETDGKRTGYFWHCAENARVRERQMTPNQRIRFDRTVNFWLGCYANLPDNTWGCIYFDVIARLEALLDGTSQIDWTNLADADGETWEF